MITPVSVLTSAAAGVGLTMVFQPIVALTGGEIVGYEALARWPELNVARVEEVFLHAATTGVVDTLDRLCAESAIESALRAGLPPGSVLLINSEPSSTYVPSPSDPAFAAAAQRFQIIVELTERDLLARPGALMRRVEELREIGCGVALDDVGAHPDSLALLDIVSPDIVKLDMTFAQSALQPNSVRTLSGLLAYRERTGAVILAEGIESAAHYEQALVIGASLGQGFHFGRPGVVDFAADSSVDYRPPVLPRPPAIRGGSVFDLIAPRAPSFTVDAHTAMALSRELARKAEHGTYRPMVLAAVERLGRFTTELAERYQSWTAAAPLIAVFGTTLPKALRSGMRSVAIHPEDPLGGEWLLLILSSDVAAAIALRPRPGTEIGRRSPSHYDLTITHSRSLVALAARNMLDRMP